LVLHEPEAEMAAEIGIFELAERRLGWIDTRQRLLAQNIANADTPNYVPRDIQPFSAVLDSLPMQAVRTNPMHLAAFATPSTLQAIRPAQRSPDGNAVSVETELTKVADDESQQSLVTNLWKSYLGMYMTALGRNG
jgi:flagellar basal-body rod protein FlgB